MDEVNFAIWIALNHFGCTNESSGVLYWSSESMEKENITTDEMWELYLKEKTNG